METDLEMGAGVINRLNDAGLMNQVRARLRSDLVQATIGAIRKNKVRRTLPPSAEFRIADLVAGTETHSIAVSAGRKLNGDTTTTPATLSPQPCRWSSI